MLKKTGHRVGMNLSRISFLLLLIFSKHPLKLINDEFQFLQGEEEVNRTSLSR